MKAYTLQPEEREALGRVVQEYRELGALEPHPTTQRFWQSPVFGREKKGGKKWRLVTDLKRLNVHILNPPFKMEGIKTARETINPGDWVGKIDISNAFFHLPINHAHQNYLVIEWEGELLHFTALPFGLNVSPRVFTKTFRIPMKLLRRWGMRLVHYIDDILIVGRTREEARAHLYLTLALLVALGFVISWPKVEEPTQKVEFLGFLFDTRDFTISVVPEKLEKTQAWLRDILNRQAPISARELSQIAGKLGSFKEAIPCAHLYTRNLNVLINEARRQGGWAQGKTMLNPHARADLEWWLRPDLITSQQIRHSPPRWLLTTDASVAGWGGFLTLLASGKQVGNDMHRQWTAGDLKIRSINPLELRAGVEALRLRTLALSSTTVLWRSDNTAVVHSVNKLKSQSLDMNRCLRTLNDWCTRQNVKLVVEHLAGVENTHADALSRWVDPSDYKLHPKLFAKVIGLLGKPSVDGFASSSNHLLPRYWSLKEEPGTEAVDCLVQPWARERLLWLNPPFALIPRVLARLREQRARALLCTPLWEGRPWWPALMGMATRPSLLLPTGKSTFLPGTTRNLRGIGPTPFTCVVTHVSGVPGEAERARAVWGPDLHRVDESLARRMALHPVGDLTTRELPIWGGDVRLIRYALPPSEAAVAPW
jgi:hypothetical protein